MVIRLFLLVFVLLFSGIASADELSQSLTNPERPAGVSEEPGVLRLGPMAIHPYLTVKEARSDNIYAVPEGKSHDFITYFVPGLYLELPVKAHTLSLNANMTNTRYAKFSSEDTDDYFVDGKGNFNFGSLFNVKLSEDYTKSHEPRTSSANGLLEKFQNNAATASLTYLLADVSKVRLDYSRNMWKYRTEGFRNRDEDLLSAYIYYRILPKTSAFVEYDFKNESFIDKTNGLDNKVQSGFFGLFWEASAKSNVTIKGGYLMKDFNLSSQGSVNTWTASVDANYYFSDFTSLKLVAKRDVNEAAILGTRYYVTTGLSGELTHRFLERLSAVASAGYWVDKYSDTVAGDAVARRDKSAYTGFGLRYFMLRWLEADLDYNNTNKISNISLSHFSENRETLALKAAF